MNRRAGSLKEGPRGGRRSSGRRFSATTRTASHVGADTAGSGRIKSHDQAKTPSPAFPPLPLNVSTNHLAGSLWKHCRAFTAVNEIGRVSGAPWSGGGIPGYRERPRRFPCSPAAPSTAPGRRGAAAGADWTTLPHRDARVSRRHRAPHLGGRPAAGTAPRARAWSRPDLGAAARVREQAVRLTTGAAGQAADRPDRPNRGARRRRRLPRSCGAHGTRAFPCRHHTGRRGQLPSATRRAGPVRHGALTVVNARQASLKRCGRRTQAPPARQGPGFGAAQHRAEQQELDRPATTVRRRPVCAPRGRRATRPLARSLPCPRALDRVAGNGRVLYWGRQPYSA